MSKHNFLNKKVKKQILSINDLIESNFNKIKYFRSNYKKILLSKENRVVLLAGTVVILTLSYLLIPTFYDKDKIQYQIKNQILKNYDLDLKFNEEINYILLPRPHFSAKNLSILRNKKEIGLTKNLRVFIGLGKFFSFRNEVEIKDLAFHKTDFNIYLNDFLFFKNLLKTAPNENRIFLKEVIFFLKIKMKMFYSLIRYLIVSFIMIQIIYKMCWFQKMKFLKFLLSWQLKMINLIKKS